MAHNNRRTVNPHAELLIFHMDWKVSHNERAGMLFATAMSVAASRDTVAAPPFAALHLVVATTDGARGLARRGLQVREGARSWTGAGAEGQGSKAEKAGAAQDTRGNLSLPR